MSYTERINDYKTLDINKRINAKSWLKMFEHYNTEKCALSVIEDVVVKWATMGDMLSQHCHSAYMRVLIYQFPWLNIKRSARRECPPSVHRRMAREFKREFGKDIDAEDDI